MTGRTRRVQIKRVYEQAEAADGTRVLVDRLWPRGAKKEDAHIDLWLRQLAPSRELRTWYGHVPERFLEFRRLYKAELAKGEAHEAVDQLRQLSQKGPVTLVFAARDAEHSNAAVLRDLLKSP